MTASVSADFLHDHQADEMPEDLILHDRHHSWREMADHSLTHDPVPGATAVLEGGGTEFRSS